MKISKIKIHNFRSITDAEISISGFLMLVGANNVGKSNVINALRCFYEDLKWNQDDFPKVKTNDSDVWVQITYLLTDDEWSNLADKYKKNAPSHELTLRRYFVGSDVSTKQSNIHAIVDGVEEKETFYGAKNVSAAKCGNVICIPALTTPAEQMKTTGPSPLKNILSIMLKKIVKKSKAFGELNTAFEHFNNEAKKETGFLTEIQSPLNNALNNWGIEIDFSISSIATDDIVKNLISCSFIDTTLAGNGLELSKYGHGFQRSVIYELIKIAPQFKDEAEATKKDFNPDLTLILFEEPEAFLHPAQQENMATNLRDLSSEIGQQVFITTHSPIFVGKNSDNIGQICRLSKSNGITQIHQMPDNNPNSLFADNCDLIHEIQNFSNSASCDTDRKNRIENFLRDYSSDVVAQQKDRFRFQLWLNTDRAAMFFADKVLLVEGETEKALFNYLLAHDWKELSSQHIFVISALGKYNFYRYMSLFSYFGIPHGMMFDNDNDKNEHIVINQFIKDNQNIYSLGTPYLFNKNLENFLEISIPGNDEMKSLQVLKHLEEKTLINHETKLEELKTIFCQVLNIMHGD